jgi:hypothetical protein
MFSGNAVVLLENAVRGTYTKFADDAERPARQTVKYLFQGAMSREKKQEQFAVVSERQIRRLFDEVRDVMHPKRADGKVSYQLNLQTLKDWVPSVEAAPKNYDPSAQTSAARQKRAQIKAERDRSVELANLMRQPITIERVRSWAAAA